MEQTPLFSRSTPVSSFRTIDNRRLPVHTMIDHIINSPTSPEEAQAIRDLRTIIPSIENLSDNYILRWLRSFDLRFDQCAEALKKHVVFRKAWQLDDGHWEAPECLEKYCGYGYLSDKEGNPILMSLLGNMDVEGMLKSVATADYIKFSLVAIEKGIQLCEERAKQTGKPFEQMMLVFDLDHISAAHFSCRQFASSFTTLIMLFQEHYPLVLKKVLIIRAPEMARLAYSTITSFLSESISSLIEMPSESDWKRALEKYVSLDAWPMHWGGQLAENGDPICPSKIRYGLGPVPDTYYVNPDTVFPDYDQLTTVYAGDKHLIQIRVKENSRISWQYMTTDEDIGFAIHYDPTMSADNLTEMEPIYPYIRLECSTVPISGGFTAEKPGTYIIEFDNYYSWFSAKKLRYNIEIDEC
ncbi:hypothetical protein PENTCL1PPCAC_22256 [Pristionchus entomophagus]|uniref:Uncharacterized protein n=1 Tax=Pristionchus entomophagus TaxID=358040 RepID=A0AAV5TZX7_9BILA|nr:hypothetical protein PENTCL1PPCAC_22256 [Pristionchus entomophagus]